MQLDTDRVRAEREKRAWSQSQLEQVSGLGLRTVQRIESTGTASFESATALASVLEIEVAELIDSSTRPNRVKTLIALSAASAFALLTATFLSSWRWRFMNTLKMSRNYSLAGALLQLGLANRFFILGKRLVSQTTV